MSDSHQNEPVCGWCNLRVTPNSAKTILSCGHSYHASCLHGPYTRSFSHCIICEKTESREGIYESELQQLDFGDDSLNSKRREIYEEKLNIIAPLDLQTFPFRVDAERLRQGVIKSKGEKKGLLEIMTTISEGIRLKHDDIGPLLDSRTSAVTLVRDKNVDAESLWRRGMTMNRLLKNGYNINDFIVFRATWYDLTQMSFTAEDWRDYKAALPPEDMIKFFQITMHDVLPICNYNLTQYANIGFRVEDLTRLETTADTLFNLPNMDKHAFMAFELNMEDWKIMNLKFNQMKKIGLEKEDLKTMKWIDDDKEGAQLSTFKSFFGKSADALKRRVKHTPIISSPPNPSRIDSSSSRSSTVSSSTEKKKYLSFD